MKYDYPSKHLEGHAYIENNNEYHLLYTMSLVINWHAGSHDRSERNYFGQIDLLCVFGRFEQSNTNC